GPPASIKDMEHFVLLHDTDNHWPLYLRHLFGSDQCTPIMSFTFSLTMLAIIAAGLGQGVALATEAFVEGELRAGSLVKLFESPLFVDQSFNLMTRETALRNHAVRAVCDWLQLQGEPYRAPTPVADV